MQLSRQCPFPLHLAIYAEADIVGFKQYLLTVDCALVEAGAARIGGTGNVGSDVTCHILGISVADENLLIGKGHNQNGDYELLFTADTMELCGIKIPDSGLEAVIEDFQTIDVPPVEAAS